MPRVDYHNTTRNLLIILSFTIMTFLNGCGSVKRDPEGKTVTFWHSMGVGSHKATIADMCNDFMKANQGIKVLPVYQGGYSDVFQKLIAAVTAGTNPSLSQMYESWTSRFLSRNHVVPVQKFIDQDSEFKTKDIPDFYNSFIQDNTWGGELVSLPFNKSVYVLYYNDDMLRECGFNHPPSTWEEMRDMCQKIIKRDSSGKVLRYGYAMRSTLESFTTLFFTNEGKYLGEDGKQILLGGQEGRETINFLQDLLFKDKVAYIESDYLSNAFGSERFAMFIGSTASFPYNDKAVAGKFTWKVAPIPRPKGKKGGALIQGTNIGIFSNCTPKEQENAWKLLRYLTNVKNSTLWAIRTGYVPIRKSCLEQPEMKKYLADNPNYAAVIPELENGVFEPKEEYWESMRNLLTRELDAFLNGNKTGDEMLDSAVKKCQFILEAE